VLASTSWFFSLAYGSSPWHNGPVDGGATFWTDPANAIIDQSAIARTYRSPHKHPWLPENSTMTVVGPYYPTEQQYPAPQAGAPVKGTVLPPTARNLPPVSETVFVTGGINSLRVCRCHISVLVRFERIFALYSLRRTEH
jgi:hypothetical protein